MNSYRTSTWGDEISLEYGKSLKGYQNSNGKYQVFGSNGPIGWTDKPLCKGPGIILGRKGAYRGVKFSEKDFYVIDTAYYVVPKTDLDLNWLYYAIKYHKLGEIDDGSPIPSTTRAAVYVREFDIPSKEVQVKIGNILKKIDLKIELNNQVNKTLESIAQAIFKSWFVDFDPVRAKIAAKLEGEGPEFAAMCAISGKSQVELQQMSEDDFAELQATATLFPDELVESGLGEVPKGWELQQLKDIAKYSSNKISLNGLTLENYISTENMLSEKKGIEKASSLPKVNSVPAFKKGNILVSNIRPYFKKIWFSSFEGGHSNDVLNFEVLEEGCEEYLYNLIYQDSFFDQMMASSKGSKMPRGDKKAIMSFQVVIPSITLRRLYSRKVGKFYFKKNVIEKENQVLKSIRDTLLPKLLSGEIKSLLVQDKR